MRAATSPQGLHVDGPNFHFIFHFILIMLSHEIPLSFSWDSCHVTQGTFAMKYKYECRSSSEQCTQTHQKVYAVCCMIAQWVGDHLSLA